LCGECTLPSARSDINELTGAALLRGALRRAAAWAAVIDAQHFSSDADLADVLTTLSTRTFMRVGGVPPALARSLLPRLGLLAPRAAAALAPPYCWRSRAAIWRPAPRSMKQR
jgi:hypothetical protein